MSTSQPTAIPVGSQFSPQLIDLHEFLIACIEHSGDIDALQSAIWVAPVHRRRSGIPSSSRTAMLPLEAAVQYGLLEESTYKATDVAKTLVEKSGDEMHEEFARHILLNCGGLRVVEAAQQMKIDGLDIDSDLLPRYLTQQGFFVAEHNTAINTMRMWLAKVGVFTPRGWDVNASRKQEVLGLSDEAVGILVGFTKEQQAFVKALCHIAPIDWYKAADVRDLAETAYGINLGRAALPKDILEPLKQAGLIEYESGGTQGGKSSKLKTTEEFNAKVLEQFIDTTTKTLDEGVIAYYRLRPKDIYQDLKSNDKQVKGKALEAYAIHIMRLLGLRFLEWRKRADTTGQAEVDATLAGLMGSVYTRWQIQCKNTPSSVVRLDDVAKEVGLLPITNATHILLIANCKITNDARRYAATIMRRTGVTIHLLDKADYDEIESSPGSIGRIIREQAEAFARQEPDESFWNP